MLQGLRDVLAPTRPRMSSVQFKITVLTLGSRPPSVLLQTLALKVLTVIATAMENISQNTLLEYTMSSDLFTPLLEVWRVGCAPHPVV